MKSDLQTHAIAIGKGLLTERVSVYTSQQLFQTIRMLGQTWGVNPDRFGLQKTRETLVELGILQRVTLHSDGYRDVERLAVAELHPATPHYATSLRSGSYLCHLSAVYLHGLTDQLPRTYYVNKEQSPKPSSSGDLSQNAIDQAFSRPQRKSKYEFRLEKDRVVLLSGKSTGRLGVVTDIRTNLDVTDIERTLIDIAVRPRYSGGVFQVSKAYKTAVKEVDIAKLLRFLGMMNYKYPYHQSIGFYLWRAGVPESDLQPFWSPGMYFDFYLDYSIAHPVYNELWRVYHPQGV
jgi:predicted transcriptional regulator of viral defense system